MAFSIRIDCPPGYFGATHFAGSARTFDQSVRAGLQWGKCGRIEGGTLVFSATLPTGTLIVTGSAQSAGLGSVFIFDCPVGSPADIQAVNNYANTIPVGSAGGNIRCSHTNGPLFTGSSGFTDSPTAVTQAGAHSYPTGTFPPSGVTVTPYVAQMSLSASDNVAPIAVGLAFIAVVTAIVWFMSRAFIRAAK